MTQIVVPTLGESVKEATIAKWLKNVGEAVKADEPIVALETDKVTLEVNAPADGVITSVFMADGDKVKVGAVIGEMEEGAEALAGSMVTGSAESKVAAAPARASVETKISDEPKTSPAVRKLLADNNLLASQVPVSGKSGRLTKGDVEKYLASAPSARREDAGITPLTSEPVSAQSSHEPREERIKMSKLRQVIAKRMKDSQDSAAVLTTFNEVDMGPVIELRNEYRDIFEEKHGIRLGFMSFFVKAAVQALKEFPSINAQIDGEDVIFKNYYNICVAVSTPQGIIVPVIREADTLSMAEIESRIVDFRERALEGQLAMDEMEGGSYTITNGGVFGSLMSTQLLNTPQSGILAMHVIQNRPVVMEDGSIEARPMMYLAQSYDHRIVDGREAVSSLIRIKQILEDPCRMVLDV